MSEFYYSTKELKLSRKRIWLSSFLAFLIPLASYLYTERWKALLYFSSVAIAVAMTMGIVITQVPKQLPKEDAKDFQESVGGVARSIGGPIGTLIALTDNWIAIDRARKKTNESYNYSDNKHSTKVYKREVDMKEDNKELPEDFEEYPEWKHIARKRNFGGRLKVFLTWFVIWNSLFQFGTSAVIALLVAATSIPNSVAHPIQRILTIPNLFISAKAMQNRMERKARERWKLKYGE